MKKDGLMSQLENIRIQAEQGDKELREILKYKTIGLLLDFINNDEIRKKTEEIPL